MAVQPTRYLGPQTMKINPLETSEAPATPVSAEISEN
jgi:hypothetical protein